MGFKSTVNRIKRTLLCCREEKKKPLLKIGPTTDVRRMDITEGMPDLTEADAKLIQEKATNDAYRLLSLQSHPPTQPTTPLDRPADPFASTSALPTPSDPFASASASAAASQTHLPAPSPGSARSQARPLLGPTSSTPPHASPTTLRTAPQKIWDKTRRLSGLSRRSSHRSSTLYTGLERSNKRDEPLIIELDARETETETEKENGKDAEVEDTMSGASASARGFQVQDTVGGTPEGTPVKRSRAVESPLIDKAMNATEVRPRDSSESEAEVETRPLVRA